MILAFDALLIGGGRRRFSRLVTFGVALHWFGVWLHCRGRNVVAVVTAAVIVAVPTQLHDNLGPQAATRHVISHDIAAKIAVASTKAASSGAQNDSAE
jgi:hypothetical protein